MEQTLMNTSPILFLPGIISLILTIQALQHPLLYLVRAISIDHLENQEHNPLVMGCDTLKPKDIRSSNIQQTTNPLIARLMPEMS